MPFKSPSPSESPPFLLAGFTFLSSFCPVTSTVFFLAGWSPDRSYRCWLTSASIFPFSHNGLPPGLSYFPFGLPPSRSLSLLGFFFAPWASIFSQVGRSTFACKPLFLPWAPYRTYVCFVSVLSVFFGTGTFPPELANNLVVMEPSVLLKRIPA